MTPMPAEQSNSPLCEANLRAVAPPKDLMAIVVGSLVAAIGLVVMAGWHLGIEGVTQIRPGFTPMAYVTATCFTGLGAALAAMGFRQDRLAQVMAGMCGLIVVATLLHVTAGVPLDLQDWLAVDNVDSLHAKHMAINTAIALLAVSVGICVHDRDFTGWRTMTMAFGGFICVAIGLNSLLGYLSGVQTFAWSAAQPMAVHTAMGTILLGSGVAMHCGRRRGPKGTVRPSWAVTITWISGVVTSISLWRALLIGNLERGLPVAVLVAGISVTSLLAMSIHWARTASARAKAAEDARRQLEREVTERTRAEAELRHRQAELNYTQHLAHLGRWFLDSRSLPPKWSDEVSQMLGLDPAAPVPCWPDLRSICEPGSWEQLDAALEHAFTAGAPFDLDVEVRRARAPNGWIRFHGEVVHGSTGIISGVQGFVQDVTPMKRAELARQESERAFSTLVDVVPQMIWICTPDGLSAYFNQRWIDYTGLTVNESSGRNWFTPFHPDDQAAAKAAWERATETGDPYGIESRVRAANGRYRWFLVRSLPLRDAKGRIAKWFGTCTDIEDLKDAEEKLRSTNDALKQAGAYNRSLIEASLDPLVTISPDGRITDVNHATEQITGYTREELIGSDFSNYFTDPARARGGYEKAYRDGFVHDYELEIRSDKGITTPVIYNASIYRDDRGNVTGVFAAARDITERKRAEAEVAAMNATLETRVARRTAELGSAIQELESFSYSASHDLRAPLRAVDGFARILLEDYCDKLDGKAQEMLRRVRTAGQRMDGIIDGMMELSRTVRAAIRRVPVDMTTVARSVGQELETTNPGRDIDFVVAPGLTVNADPNLLRIALQNLLENAWKFTSKHPKARIEVGTAELDNEIVYFVRDDGAGYDMAYAGKLFGAFQRMHKPDEFEGTGIGLAIVQRIVHRHGGRIWAHSEVENGATFYFTFGRDEGVGK